MLNDCGMLDFPYKGNSFSWVGRRRSGKVKCRLDRALGNEEWMSKFSHSSVEYMKLWGSDHRLVLAMIKINNIRRKKSFRFDKKWIGKPGFKETVVSGWGPFDEFSRRDFHQKVTQCRKNISIWKKSNPSNSERMIEELKNQLDLAQDDENTTLEEIEEIRRKLCVALREEEMFWQQKSREKWHKDGDKNTKFFHALTKQRRARNRIVALKDSNGHLVENARGIERVALQYFQKLFSSSIPSDLEDSLRFITEKVSDNDNEFLLKDPSENEIKDALFDINPDKAPGPDGMTSKFYQKFWRFLRQDIVKLVLINGEPKGNIKPSRGLRQGDPLSPFLFILCTEGLISLLKGAEEEDRISGLKIAQASPPVSHLFFADDSLFFCKADIHQGAEIFKIIDTYGKASGQQLNLGKSSIMFGNRVDPNLKRSIKNSIGITSVGGMGMYLGLPEQICGSKKKVFSFVHDRLSNRVNNWSARLLSKGGKDIQIKSVAQAVPTYVMSCFLLPKGVTDKLRSAIANFWWSSKQNSSGIHWIAWDKICIPQDMGGLGFRDLNDFNLALLAKQLWRLIQYPSSLLARVLRGRYYRQSDPLEDRNVYSPSYGWRSMLAAKPYLKMGLRKTIGSGLNTRAWSEPWIPDARARSPRAAPQIGFQDPGMLV
ncbi:uncharacterized protein LOC112085326 [Eutrema salsugineum]|uniref:uncharacterized protein LOC112085326 n=1 Tax=Eutrema salsugineum TaxID=72664 RepID=UPI000CED6B50|nr:uncharacterized protein LOC112085326 [Eutrema salsugineum]